MKSNPSTIALGLLGAAIALYALAVQPCSKALVTARAKLAELTSRQVAMEMDVANKASLEKRIALLEKATAANRAALISPMLNSYAMRAKSFLDAFAREAGLVNVEYHEGGMRTLPVPGAQLPLHRTARRSVKITATGDYAAAISFILRAEKELPLMAMQALKVTPQKDDPVAQSIELTVEWPVEGEVIK